MEDNSQRFQKFIIKKLVSTVEYNAQSGEYVFNRVHLSDDMLRTIENEGQRYDIQPDVVRQMVSNLASNIRVDPSLREVHSSLEPAKMTPGQHFDIHINHPDKGRRHVELLALGARMFFLLSSDISGLEYGMTLFAIDKVWNNAFNIDFQVSRDGKPFPNKSTILRIGKLERVDLYQPSTIHEILDANTDFAFEKDNSTEGSPTKKKHNT